MKKLQIPIWDRLYRPDRFLRDPKVKAIIKVQDTILEATRKFLHSKGFIELLVPVIAPVTDPGIRQAQFFEMQFYNQRARLVSSAILYKIASMIAFEKIYTIAINIRKEPIDLENFDRTLSEFRQIDIEVKEASRKQIQRLSEDLIIHIIKSVKHENEEELKILGRDLRIPHKPFREYTFREAVEFAETFGYGIGPDGELSRDAEIALSKVHYDPFWILDYPKEVRGFYYKEKEDGTLLDMDLIFPEGFGEGASGGERELEPVKVVQRMRITGVEPSEYEWFLKVLESGITKCSGIGFGVERLTRWICGLESIVEAIPFPKLPGYLGV